MATERKKLGQILKEAGIINEMQLSVALGQQKRWGGKLGRELIRSGFIRENDLAAVLEKQLGIKWVSLIDRSYTPELIALVKPDIALKYLVVPVEFDGKFLTMATIDPTDLKTLDELQFALGKKIKPVIATESEIKNAISRNYSGATVTIKIDEVISSEARYEESERYTNMTKNEVVLKTSLEVLVDMLTEKGVISMEEFSKRITEKHQ